MTEKNNNSASSSINFGWLGLLGAVFVVLKLNPGGYVDSGVESWSWWLVLLPFYGGLAFLLALAVLGGLTYFGATLIDKRNAKKRRKEHLAARKPGDLYLGR
jgi:heme A synthase